MNCFPKTDVEAPKDKYLTLSVMFSALHHIYQSMIDIGLCELHSEIQSEGRKYHMMAEKSIGQ